MLKKEASTLNVSGARGVCQAPTPSHSPQGTVVLHTGATSQLNSSSCVTHPRGRRRPEEWLLEPCVRQRLLTVSELFTPNLAAGGFPCPVQPVASQPLRPRAPGLVRGSWGSSGPQSHFPTCSAPSLISPPARPRVSFPCLLFRPLAPMVPSLVFHLASHPGNTKIASPEDKIVQEQSNNSDSLTSTYSKKSAMMTDQSEAF